MGWSYKIGGTKKYFKMAGHHTCMANPKIGTIFHPGKTGDDIACCHFHGRLSYGPARFETGGVSLCGRVRMGLSISIFNLGIIDMGKCFPYQ